MTAAAESIQGQRRRARTAPAAIDFLHGGGWRAVSPDSGDRCGLTAHRGVLHPDEWKWLDWGRVAVIVEVELGYTVAELRSVYRQGRLSASQRELRARVDARLLALRRSGGNMTLLGRILGFHVGSDGQCCVIHNALARGTSAEGGTRSSAPLSKRPWLAVLGAAGEAACLENPAHDVLREVAVSVLAHLALADDRGESVDDGSLTAPSVRRARGFQP